MTALPALKQDTLYEQLCKLPENRTGEIINGQLHSQPRPSGRHGLAGGTPLFILAAPSSLVATAPAAGGSFPNRKFISCAIPR